MEKEKKKRSERIVTKREAAESCAAKSAGNTIREITPIRFAYHDQTPPPQDSTPYTVKMKVEICSFSQRKIYPGKGRLYVRGDNKVFRFASSKNESLFLQRKNPRKIAWTVVYRRMHKKGITEEVAKKRSRKAVKHQRGIVGASLESIAARRNQKPEVRAAARQQAIAKSKEDKKTQAEQRKANKGTNPSAKVSRQQMKGATSKPRV